MNRLEGWHCLVFLVLLTALVANGASLSQASTGTEVTPTPAPTPDRLAEPDLPDNPTQYEQGRHVYWLNCMPCHGDVGQGLTDEFRSIWEEEHQDCWASGCHGGRAEDEGFPLPRTIPAVIFLPGNQAAFAMGTDLFEYLRTTHPPQHPGKLTEEDYWAVTAFIMVENQALPAGKKIGPRNETLIQNMTWWLAAAGLALLAASASFALLRRRRNFEVPDNKPEPPG